MFRMRVYAFETYYLRILIYIAIAIWLYSFRLQNQQNKQTQKVAQINSKC